MTLHQWAARWGVSLEAVADLQRTFGMEGDARIPSNAPMAPHNETEVTAIVRLEASRKGLCVWRNNVGAMEDKSGRHVRFGLANDSAAINARVKSADLIGIRPVIVTSAHVGHTIGQFVSREAKAPGWMYTATPREEAQLRWANIVAGLGGDAAFCTGEGSL